MITFVTGVPGAGKTLFTIDRVLSDWCKPDQEARKIYYCNIRDVNIPGWEEINKEQVAEWYTLPPGSIVICDEVQQVFPRRAPNKPIPEGVQRLDTHRHQGYDFYFITQKPTNADHDLRGYAGEHYHYDRLGGLESAREFFWNRAVSDPMNFPDKDDAQVQRRVFPKKVYAMYKSSDMHTVQKKMPKKLYLFAFLGLLTMGLGVRVYSNIASHDEIDQFQPDEYLGQSIPSGAYVPRHSDQGEVLTVEQYKAQWEPRVDDLPFSAPAYDEVTEVKTFPRPQCIYRHRTNTCKCYTQQATPLDMSGAVCRSIVKGGWFNPYKEEGTGDDSQRALAAANPPPVQEYKFQQPEPGRQTRNVVIIGKDAPQVAYKDEIASPDGRPPEFKPTHYSGS